MFVICVTNTRHNLPGILRCICYLRLKLQISFAYDMEHNVNFLFLLFSLVSTKVVSLPIPNLSLPKKDLVIKTMVHCQVLKNG